ncbi:MAG: transglycosylase SLT domain-containing protein [Myxococcales bacterium]|nr:transglycosylase SLT domain-containing protein [Myxococcales bacterium]
MVDSSWKSLLVVVGALACGCSATASSPSPAEMHGESPHQAALQEHDAAPIALAEEPPVSPLSAEFPEAEMVLLFSGGTAAEALRLFRRQEYDLAHRVVVRGMGEELEPELRGALQILSARIERERGNWEAAGVLFASASENYPQIDDYLHFEAARAFAKAGKPEASQHAELVDAQGPWGQDMAFLIAEASRVRGDSVAAIARYREFLTQDTSLALQSEARLRLGEVLESQQQPKAARAEWRSLLVTDPTSSWAMMLRAKDKKLDASLTGEERIVRGMAYFRAMRNVESEADFAKALGKRNSLSGEQRCQALFHRAKSIYKERDYKRAAPRFVPAIAACKASGNTNYEVKSAYQAGLAYGRLREYKRSARYFRYVENYPEHSYADDSRLRRAEQHAALGEDEKVETLLSSIPKLYPKGDMRGEAMWRLARRSYFKKNYGESAKWLAEQIRVAPIAINWWAEGQAQYWLGRSLTKQGKIEESATAYRDCIRLYPLTYYSLQSFARLKESFPEQYAEALTEVASQKSPWLGTLKDRSVYQGAGFRAALTLAQLGIGDATRRQLAAIGMSIPEGRKAVTDASHIDRLVATSRVLDLAGDYSHSHWPGRWHTVDYRRSWPTGANLARWRLAYPLAFWGLLQEFAGKYTYPPHLQMAIVREESAFDPSRESWANAIGLTQMIFPTAIDHSKESGIPVTRENLQHPVKNVTIGSHFLQSLQKAFDGRVGLMVPGYNAGRARMRGWIRQRNRYDLDEFIELIPGDQARRYTKRVLGSYFVYSYLGDDKVPDIRNAVPRKLGNL